MISNSFPACHGALIPSIHHPLFENEPSTWCFQSDPLDLTLETTGNLGLTTIKNTKINQSMQTKADLIQNLFHARTFFFCILYCACTYSELNCIQCWSIDSNLRRPNWVKSFADLRPVVLPWKTLRINWHCWMVCTFPNLESASLKYTLVNAKRQRPSGWRVNIYRYIGCSGNTRLLACQPNHIQGSVLSEYMV